MFEQGLIQLQDPSDKSKVANITATGLVNSQNVLLRKSDGGVIGFGKLVPEEFDYIDITYTGTNPTTIVYKTGGVGGTTVTTLTITYDGSNNPLTIART